MSVGFDLVETLTVDDRICACVLWDDRPGIAWWTESVQWGGGELLGFGRNGVIEARLDQHLSQPNCVAFRRPALDHRLITTAHEGLAAAVPGREPLAGALLVYRTSARGRAENRCPTAFSSRPATAEFATDAHAMSA